MDRLRRLFYVLCGLLAVTGCGAPGDRYGDPANDSPTAARAVPAGIDWSAAERVTIRLSDFEFAPDTPVFRAGTPYLLLLENDGGSGHTFTAPEFFRAVALHDLTPATGERPPGILESVAVKGGQQRTLRFVPVTAGTYPLVCERPLHDVFGMHGTIRVE